MCIFDYIHIYETLKNIDVLELRKYIFLGQKFKDPKYCTDHF